MPRSSVVNDNQLPLRDLYKQNPDKAQIEDHAIARGDDPADPFHSLVQPMPGTGGSLPVGVHRGVGGLHDAATPGDILCAALAACQDSTIRMVANLLGVELESLEVEVRGEVDLRGTLMVDKSVPVGFQKMHCDVRLKAKEGTKQELLDILSSASQASCVVQQTLRQPPEINTRFTME